MQFHGLIDIGEKYKEIKMRNMRIQFADLCLNTEPINNESVYNTLSHLAQIKELCINLGRYENLRVYPNSERLNSDTYVYAKQKLKEAKCLWD